MNRTSYIKSMLKTGLSGLSVQLIPNYDKTKLNEGFIYFYIDNANKKDVQSESKSNKGLVTGTTSAVIDFFKYLDTNTDEDTAYDLLYDFVDEIEIALRKIKADTFTKTGQNSYIVDITAIYETDEQLVYLPETDSVKIAAQININIDFYQNNLFQ